jgi:hypothetical protein
MQRPRRVVAVDDDDTPLFDDCHSADHASMENEFDQKHSPLAWSLTAFFDNPRCESITLCHYATLFAAGSSCSAVRLYLLFTYWKALSVHFTRFS